MSVVKKKKKRWIFNVGFKPTLKIILKKLQCCLKTDIVNPPFTKTLCFLKFSLFFQTNFLSQKTLSLYLHRSLPRNRSLALVRQLSSVTSNRPFICQLEGVQQLAFNCLFIPDQLEGIHQSVTYNHSFVPDHPSFPDLVFVSNHPSVPDLLTFIVPDLTFGFCIRDLSIARIRRFVIRCSRSSTCHPPFQIRQTVPNLSCGLFELFDCSKGKIFF